MNLLKRKIQTAKKIYGESGIAGVAAHASSIIALLFWSAVMKIYCKKNFPVYSLDGAKSLEACDFLIAVHVHLYYEDLADEFCGYLANIPFDFDLYISLREGVETGEIEKKFRSLRSAKNIFIQNVENRGRDLLPFYGVFGKELAAHKYVLHVHSKKSLAVYGYERLDWRRNSMDALCGSEDLVRKIFYLFENDGAGLVYPENYENVHPASYSWQENKTLGKTLLKKVGAKCPSGFFLFPAGSFFWARTDAIRPLFDLGLGRMDFPEEAGQKNGTLAHALERAVAIVSRAQGYEDVFLDIRGQAFRSGFSPLAFRGL